MPPLITDLLYIPLAILYLPVLLYQMIVLKKNRRGWLHRLGFIRPRIGHKPCIWIHAVSLGEVNATRSLVAEIHRRLPAFDIAISATTDTGFKAAVAQYQPKTIFRYPLDFSMIVRRTLNRIRPAAIVLMELEVWPNLLRIAQVRGIPVIIVNGRITEARSMRRYRLPLVRAVARRMFQSVSLVGAQNETYAARFAELGVPCERISVTGTMKYDTAAIADGILGDEALAHALEIDANSPLIVAGSTGPCEEEALLASFQRLRARHPTLQLAIIPRKPERFEEVARLIASRGFACIRRTEHPDLVGDAARAARRRRTMAQVRQRSSASNDESESSREAGSADTQNAPAPVFLGDTMGELRKFYSLAQVVFVGRTLVPLGGSDLMEVAGLAKPMCFGPHVDNFADVAEKLLAGNAAHRVPDSSELEDVIDRMLTNADASREMGGRAREIVRQSTGATRQSVDLICNALGKTSDHPNRTIATALLE